MYACMHIQMPDTPCLKPNMYLRVSVGRSGCTRRCVQTPADLMAPSDDDDYSRANGLFLMTILVVLRFCVQAILLIPNIRQFLPGRVSTVTFAVKEDNTYASQRADHTPSTPSTSPISLELLNPNPRNPLQTLANLVDQFFSWCHGRVWS